MKFNFISILIARLGWRRDLGQPEHPATNKAHVLDPRHIARARAGARLLRTRARALKLGTFTNEELLGFIRQGRR